jgi:thioredoxin reductase (NADPH)
MLWSEVKPTTVRDPGGYIVTRQDLLRDRGRPKTSPLERQPMLLETSVPYIFAGGDVRHGPVMRVVSAVGEGSIAILLIHSYPN